MTHTGLIACAQGKVLRLVIRHEGRPIAFDYLIDVCVSLTSLANGVAATSQLDERIFVLATANKQSTLPIALTDHELGSEGRGINQEE